MKDLLSAPVTDNGEAVPTPKEMTRKTQGDIRLYHVDHLGSTSLVTDIDGEITQHVAYIPYGEVFIEERNGVWNTPYLFNAKELDEETGLYYYGARYLNPKDTRWLSVDPMFEKYAGMSPYNYCAGNPVKLVDPNGMWTENSDGNWVAEKGDCAWTLHKQTGMSFAEAKDLMKSQGFQFSNEDSHVAVQIGDIVKSNKNKNASKSNAVNEPKSNANAHLKRQQTMPTDNHKRNLLVKIVLIGLPMCML